MSEDEALVLRWQEYSRNIGSSSAVFRRESTFSDLTLVVDGAQVQVHRFILASCSPLFLGMLRHLNHPHPVIFLRGVDHHHLLLILDFMYLGEVSVQQNELPAFLRTAEDLQVKGLTEKEDSMQEQEAATENSEVEKELLPHIPEPLQITPKGEKCNIVAGTADKKQPGESSFANSMKKRRTESKRASKRAVNNENSNTKKKRKSEEKSKHSPHESTESDKTDLLEVSQEQVKVQGMIQNAISATESEIEQLEEGFTEEEKRRKTINDNQDEEDEPSLLDATDSTISEVENMLKETRRLLREETGIGAIKKPQINGGFDDQGGKVACFNPPPSKKLASQSGKVKSPRNPSNNIIKGNLNEKLVNPKSKPGDLGRPRTPLAQTSTSDITLSTPSKADDQSEKERAIIACLVTKLSSSHGWRCTVCRAVFSSKAETEDHVGVSHVLGNLS